MKDMIIEQVVKTVCRGALIVLVFAGISFSLSKVNDTLHEANHTANKINSAASKFDRSFTKADHTIKETKKVVKNAEKMQKKGVEIKVKTDLDQALHNNLPPLMATLDKNVSSLRPMINHLDSSTDKKIDRVEKLIQSNKKDLKSAMNVYNNEIAKQEKLLKEAKKVREHTKAIEGQASVK
ncbi:hypothetical protein [Priestia koreensis]|uniref:hypothetical protein n=1 Tax=Priestia koreensis TaxID=284581 RepID=UPI00203C17B3|nr:hypothetical protein [Priestia koreensis]MCM3006426.1 hypothetical protein [Priestia koreensis]